MFCFVLLLHYVAFLLLLKAEKQRFVCKKHNLKKRKEWAYVVTTYKKYSKSHQVFHHTQIFI
jgi:hypothetical protein